ncbi:MAG: epoxyqueuosine reductase [Deltaproteobacteria bacterium]|nr:epoxyqueuosine reductase [Deltaproteobacteria bacterium]
MLSKDDVRRHAASLGFEDIGFTGAEPFDDQRRILQERMEGYAWALEMGLDLVAGTDPRNILPEAKTIIVLMEAYFREGFPAAMERHFGRCYLDDDRVLKDRLARRIKSFRSFLRDNGIDSKVPFNLPHRLAAARAGMGTFGKNCLFYANKVAGRGSWVLPIAVVVDQAFAPDEPTIGLGCPDWCRNACITACPTGALKGSRRLDPRKCISYLTYYGKGITPLELREPMGLWVYGCDRCQNVCPRNAAWLARKLPQNAKVAAMQGDFSLSRLLHMDTAYFNKLIWPHMFYMNAKEIWRWQMNAARAMGNSLDAGYLVDLERAVRENADARVRGMAAWAMGRIGGAGARKALEGFLPEDDPQVEKEIMLALDMV